MSRYLVTGAAGFIGSAIAKRLVREGHEVVTVDNMSTGHDENVPEGVLFVKGDCADPSVYEKVPQERYDAIFHIAGQSSGEISFDDPIYDVKTNTESTLLLLKFALKNGCKRFIYAGTMSVYGVQPDRPVTENDPCTPESFYGVGKLASEHYMRVYQNYGIESTSLRLFNVYGPGQNLENLKQGMVSIFLAQVLKENKIHVKGSADRFRDFIYIDDVVEAFVRCLVKQDSYNKVINVGTGIKTRVSQLVEQLVSNFDSEILVTYEGQTAGDIHGICSDISKMDELLGTWGKIDLSAGVKKFVSSCV
jgi:UDP-glucose 4-epimerase